MNNLKDKNLEDICGKGNPFSVPEGYFEQFTQQMMDKLPEKEPTIRIEQPTTTWQRVKPWFYLAAMFCGIMIGARHVLSPSASEMSCNTQIASKNKVVELQDQSYSEEYLEDALMNSHMDDYSVYCYLTNADNEG